MTALDEQAIANLREARKELIAEKKENLSYKFMSQWLGKYNAKFKAAGQRFGNPGNIIVPIDHELSGHIQTSNPEILDAIRDQIVQHIDTAISRIDKGQVVLPVLDELILKVKDTKLSTLLKEFNAAKDSEPNIAAIGFRTILCLVIQEIAKLRQPESELAKREDLALDPIINNAIAIGLFDGSEQKLVKRFQAGGQKDMFDNIAHKPGEKSLVEKENLSAAVDALLNHLLKAII